MTERNINVHVSEPKTSTFLSSNMLRLQNEFLWRWRLLASFLCWSRYFLVTWCDITLQTDMNTSVFRLAPCCKAWEDFIPHHQRCFSGRCSADVWFTSSCRLSVLCPFRLLLCVVVAHIQTPARLVCGNRLRPCESKSGQSSVQHRLIQSLHCHRKRQEPKPIHVSVLAACVH